MDCNCLLGYFEAYWAGTFWVRKNDKSKDMIECCFKFCPECGKNNKKNLKDWLAKEDISL